MCQTERLETDTTRYEKKRKIHAIESGIVDRMPPIPKHEKARNSKEFRAKSLAGAEGFEPSARGFGVDVEKASADIYQPNFRTVEPFVFSKLASR